MYIAKDHNIKISENQFIKWIELGDFDAEKTLNIDSELEKYNFFWDKLETECVAECCGIDAFNFFEKNILNSLKNINKQELITYFDGFILKIENSEYDIINSSRMNMFVRKETFLELINHIKNCLK